MIALSSANCISSPCRLHAFTPGLFRRSSCPGCKVEAVVYRVPEILLAAQVSFGGLNRRMAEQELNLLQFTAARMAQLGTGPTQIVRRDALQPCFFATALYHVPDHVLGDSFTPNLSGPAHSSKNSSVSDPGSHGPLIERLLRPGRDRNGANVPAFAD
jgi:hypothetical protein